MRFTLKTLFAVLVLVLVAAAAYYSFNGTALPGPTSGTVPRSFSVNGATYVFNFTATNSTEWQRGLMNVRITQKTTMLFMFPYLYTWSFWMYDTNASLDMIWINATGGTGRVVYVITSAQPCYVRPLCPTYTPSSAANYVIEARAGFVQENDISVGTAVIFG